MTSASKLKRLDAGLEALLDLEAFDYPPDRNPALSYVKRLGTHESRATIRASLRWLSKVASGDEISANRYPWHRIRYVDALAIVEAAVATYTPHGARLRVAALRGVLREAWRLEWLTSEEYQRTIDLPAVRGAHLPRGRHITAGELRALFATTAQDSRAIGTRDVALLALGYGGGLRRAELAASNLADLDLERGVLKVHGKGRRERAVAIVGGTRVALERWIESRGRNAGALFPASTSKGKLVRRRMSPQAIRHVWARRCKAAGVTDCSPHDFRRSHASDLLSAGFDLSTVSEQLGHAKLETTALYDIRGDSRRRTAVESLHVPIEA